MRLKLYPIQRFVAFLAYARRRLAPGQKHSFRPFKAKNSHLGCFFNALNPVWITSPFTRWRWNLKLKTRNNINHK